MTELSAEQLRAGHSPQVEIRRLHYTDLPQVIAIERRVFPTPWSLAMFVLELSKQTGICLAAVSAAADLADAHSDGVARAGYGARDRPGGGQRLIGYLICSRYDTVWHVMNVAVDIDYQRLGLASALLAELYARVGEKDARFTLEVRRSNHGAIRLYEREGFRAAGVRRRYYQDNGEDALVMWRTPATLLDRSGVGPFEDVPNSEPL
jgi:ribosomal-protein-alanine N-acetyltransferase